ncbi:hypothetical protein [Blastococcus sp. LR1]|uniref:hypothetical protein n=1 Tax=Blastococcus sp. LR1 TaxID=2877000 RepID=UPI001CCDEDD2|nr:hypothetical protein [Blastococcus sp. LR1]MCA0145844.1 hypothetical protein [Blastococcus sp. LR1]
MTGATEIWNRACDPYAPFTHSGDAALAAVLLCHGMAMNGGLLHAVEGLEPDQLAAATDGYSSLGLGGVAELITDVSGRAAALDPDDADAAEQLEIEANRRFGELVPDDETVSTAFEAHLRAHPEAYAPV